MKRAALALLLIGCKADLHHTVDAGPLDASVDSLSAQDGDPPPGAVKLKVTSIGQPVSNIAVYFQAADSSLIAATLTNANGFAWATMPAGGFVTAVEHQGNGLEALTTFSGVMSTDSLTLDLSPTGATTNQPLQLTVPSMTNAMTYAIHTPCGETAMSSTSESIQLVGCGPMADLVIVPQDTDGLPLGALYVPGVDLATGTKTVTGSYASFTTEALSYTNVPSTVTFVGVYEALSANHRAFSVTDGATPSGGAANTSIKMPPSTGTELTATTLYPASGEHGEQSIYNWHPASASYDLDLATVMLPAFAAAPTYTPASRTISWSERTPGQTPDVVRARIHVYRDAIPSGRVWSWRIAAPRTETTITYPKLPVIDFDFNPTAGDTFTVDELTTLALPGGFAGFRSQAFSDARSAISGTLGRIVEQDLYSDPL